MPDHKIENSVENATHGTFSASVNVTQPCPEGMTLVKRLPIELWERIFEFVGDISYVSGQHPVDFPDDETPYPSTTRPTALTPYDHLRSASVASRAFTAPAQRALFRVSRTHSTTGTLRLFRSLLEYPDNRKYVQWLLVTTPTTKDRIYGSNSRGILDLIPTLVQTLGPLVDTPAFDQLQNAGFFRSLVLPSTSRIPGFHGAGTHEMAEWGITDARRLLTCIFEDHIVRAILELCPQIIGLRLFHRTIWVNWSRCSELQGYPYLANDLLGQTCPRLKSLTLDVGALTYSLLQLGKCVPGYTGGCPPSVEYLKIVRTDDEVPVVDLPLHHLYGWLSSNKKLRELRLLQKADWYPHGAWEQSWNSILPLFADTLEVLVMDGNRFFEGVEYIEERFGQSGIFDCLPQLKKLKYLKAPLHYLRDDMPKFDWVTEDLGLLVLPCGGARDATTALNEVRLMHAYHEQEDNGYWPDGRPDWYEEMVGIRILRPGDQYNILGLIQSELPPSLRKLDVIVVEQNEASEMGYEWRTIELSL